MPDRRLSAAGRGARAFARIDGGPADRAAGIARLSDVGAIGGPGCRHRRTRRKGRAVKYFAPSALLPEGWENAVAIDVDEAGNIVDVEPNARADGCEILHGPVVPAMPNLHSHAFQRALAGRTG